MDPVSQAVLGATAAELFAARSPQDRAHLPMIACIGALSGMAADLDVLIQSPTDPLLFFDYHRHFTHALLFIPAGALMVAIALHFLYFRHRLSFAKTWLYCLAGYATHGILDCFTAYGTSIFWPFSDVRIAWDWIAVVDPLFTVPALVLVVLAGYTRDMRPAVTAAAWMLLYLGFGFIQHERAEGAGLALAQTRGHSPARLEVKPAVGSLLIWKILYQHQNHYHVDAVRTGADIVSWAGACAVRFTPEQHAFRLAPTSQQTRDIDRFDHFAHGYLALDGQDETTVVDLRYSMLPDEVTPLWGIRLKPNRPIDEHVEYFTIMPRVTAARVAVFWQLLRGDPAAVQSRNRAAAYGDDCPRP